MAFELREIKIIGNPEKDEMIELPVLLTYADKENLDEASEWLQVQLKAPAAYGRVLAEVERDALTLLRRLITDRIQILESLERKPQR
ncbi:hypothetical protein [Roseibium sp.]|uniref:hypothetical protein n=1 Tax=Roseibium sp. TaxID=1936156 RepID=UPI003A986244